MKWVLLGFEKGYIYLKELGPIWRVKMRPWEVDDLGPWEGMKEIV